MSEPTRVLVVLGYSTSTGSGLHPICLARVRHAMTIASARDVVLLTGWARRPHQDSEAALMADAWHVPVRSVVVDHVATTTVGNALQALATVRREQPDQVVVVTSGWHARRARSAFRQVLGDIPLSSSSPAEPTPLWRAASEVPRWLVLPAQVRSARRSTSVPWEDGAR